MAKYEWKQSNCPRKLFQKPDIVLRVQSQIVNTVFELAKPFYSHAECKTCVCIAVNAKVLKHFRMNHSAAENFYPACMFANVATNAATNSAIDIHFGAWFRKWEVGRAKTNFYVNAKHFLDKKIKRLFKVRKGNVFIHIQSFCLMKKTVCTCADGFVSINTPRANYSYWRLLFFHHTRLNAAGMSTQKPIRILMNIKSILHVAGWMIFRKIKRGKIMPVIFNFRTFCDSKSKSSENVNNLISYHTYRMPRTQR